ncbi:hypothetical protein LCGC14_1828120 [marine sediment metagenome]|uniref:Uncharacterized protein n=1 Tax=marine sediment metagenome TaxID=412755 RepID=A0A0F9GH64_9ZZZZ
MQTWVNIRDLIEQKLQDTGNAEWTPAEIDLYIPDGLTELGEYVPYFITSVFTMESRTGSATSTSSNNLVDSQAQFLSTDTDKVIYNTYDNTWAIVTAFSSTSQLTLSKDIMVSTETYEMYNKGCRNKRQINIEDITDWVGPEEHGVMAVEYPKGTRRNFTIEGDILTVDVRSVPDSKVVTPATDVEVHIWVEARQRVSQLTDLAGAIDNVSGYAAGTTSIKIQNFSGSEIVAEDTLLTIAGVRGIYRVTADVTLTAGDGTIVIHPSLIDAAAHNDVVTITGSTLNTELERLVVELTTARAATQKSIDYIDVQNTGGPVVWKDFRDWGEARLGIVLSKLERLKNRQAPRTSQTYPRD